MRSAALVQGLPLDDIPGGSNIRPEGRHESEIGPHLVVGRTVSPGYFRAMGIPFLAGRDFTEKTTPGIPRVTVINESLGRVLVGPGSDWEEVRVRLGRDGRRDHRRCARTKNTALDADPVLEAFLSSQQRGTDRFALVVAAESNPMGLVGPLRKEIRSSTLNVVVREARTMANIVCAMLAARRFLVVVLSAFSLTAVILASFGIYGVIAYSVRQRTPEIGIRMALGATKGDVLRTVLREGLRLTAVGVVVGLAGALVLTRVLANFLYGISPTDPLTFLCTSLLLTGVALLAGYIPARRAAKIDPMVALRYE